MYNAVGRAPYKPCIDYTPYMNVFWLLVSTFSGALTPSSLSVLLRGIR